MTGNVKYNQSRPKDYMNSQEAVSTCFVFFLLRQKSADCALGMKCLCAEEKKKKKTTQLLTSRVIKAKHSLATTLTQIDFSASVMRGSI